MTQRAAKLRMQGKSYGQIAQRLDIPKSSAHKRVKRCMQRLRQEFAEHEADLRDQCILSLQQGIGQIITLSSKERKTR